MIGRIGGGQVFGNITGTVIIGSPTNPKGTNPLRLAEEVRAIQNGLERFQCRALLDCYPQIVHFCGHGTGVESPDNREPGQDDRKLTVVPETNKQPEGLMFEDETGQPHWVSSDAITAHIPFVVGMKRAIGDQATIEVAIGFYDALLAGRDVEFAFKLGRSSIQLEGIPEHLTLILKSSI